MPLIRYFPSVACGAAGFFLSGILNILGGSSSPYVALGIVIAACGISTYFLWDNPNKWDIAFGIFILSLAGWACGFNVL